MEKNTKPRRGKGQAIDWNNIIEYASLNWDEFPQYQALGREDKKLFLKYITDAQRQTGRKKIKGRRIQKYLTTFGTVKKATGKGVSPAVRTLESLREAVIAIENSKYAVDTKQDTIKLLGSLFNFVKTGESQLKVCRQEGH